MSEFTLSDNSRQRLKRYETGGKMVGNKLIVLPQGEPALRAYIDDVGVITIGWGHTGRDLDGRKLTRSSVITLGDAEALLSKDLSSFERDLNNLLDGVETTQSQFDAMLLLMFNIGPDAFSKSTLLKRHKAGKYDLATNQFALWNKGTVNGKKIVLKGLTRRRAEEATIYSQSEDFKTEVGDRMVTVSSVDNSKRLVPAAPDNPAIRPGAIVAAGSMIPAGVFSVEGITSATESLQEVKSKAQELPEFPLVTTVLSVIIFILAGYIIVRKWLDRNNGVS